MNDNIKMRYVKRFFIRKIIKIIKRPAEIYNMFKSAPLWYRLWMVYQCSEITKPIASLHYKIYKFFQNIKKVIEFLPYVWGHQDWHHDFIFKFNYYLYKRLYVENSKRIKKYKREHPSYIKANEKLKTVVLLHKKLYENKYGKHPTKEIKNTFRKKTLKNKRYYNLVKKHYDFINEQKNKDIDLVYKLILKYHNYWWS